MRRSFKFSQAVILFLAFLIAAGCSKKIQTAAMPGFEKIKVIAVMPVENKTGDSFLAHHIREAVAAELFLKGYPRIPFVFIDAKAPSLKEALAMPPPAAAELIGADALLYPVLEDVKSSYRVVQASTTIRTSFILKSKTGDVLWKMPHTIAIANYDFTKKRLEMKSSIDIEPALQEMAKSVLKSLPDGPEYMGKPPEKHAFWDWF